MNTTLRHPNKNEGGKIWELVKRVGTLDLNSEYCYHMLCDVHPKQCAVVADEENNILGFVSSFLRPDQDSCLFIWQIAIDPVLQGTGQGKKLLSYLINSQIKKISHLETTISDDNLASQNLFKSIARLYKAGLDKSVYIDQETFCENHETEYLYRIGKLEH